MEWGLFVAGGTAGEEEEEEQGEVSIWDMGGGEKSKLCDKKFSVHVWMQ